ncbi:unnamed protein product [Amoebophrya sp. A120]|nr:unnamed protein product [Amoebophrya sp. A120]|eukprot:GSA120T00025403001.1
MKAFVGTFGQETRRDWKKKCPCFEKPFEENPNADDWARKSEGSKPVRTALPFFQFSDNLAVMDDRLAQFFASAKGNTISTSVAGYDGRPETFWEASDDKRYPFNLPDYLTFADNLLSEKFKANAAGFHAWPSLKQHCGKTGSDESRSGCPGAVLRMLLNPRYGVSPRAAPTFKVKSAPRSYDIPEADLVLWNDDVFSDCTDKDDLSCVSQADELHANGGRSPAGTGPASAEVQLEHLGTALADLRIWAEQLSSDGTEEQASAAETVEATRNKLTAFMGHTGREIWLSDNWLKDVLKLGSGLVDFANTERWQRKGYLRNAPTVSSFREEEGTTNAAANGINGPFEGQEGSFFSGSEAGAGASTALELRPPQEWTVLCSAWHVAHMANRGPAGRDYANLLNFEYRQAPYTQGEKWMRDLQVARKDLPQELENWAQEWTNAGVDPAQHGCPDSEYNFVQERRLQPVVPEIQPLLGSLQLWLRDIVVQAEHDLAREGDLTVRKLMALTKQQPAPEEQSYRKGDYSVQHGSGDKGRMAAALSSSGVGGGRGRASLGTVWAWGKFAAGDGSVKWMCDNLAAATNANDQSEEGMESYKLRMDGIENEKFDPVLKMAEQSEWMDTAGRSGGQEKGPPREEPPQQEEGISSTSVYSKRKGQLSMSFIQGRDLFGGSAANSGYQRNRRHYISSKYKLLAQKFSDKSLTNICKQKSQFETMGGVCEDMQSLGAQFSDSAGTRTGVQETMALARRLNEEGMEQKAATKAVKQKARQARLSAEADREAAAAAAKVEAQKKAEAAAAEKRRSARRRRTRQRRRRKPRRMQRRRSRSGLTV